LRCQCSTPKLWDPTATIRRYHVWCLPTLLIFNKFLVPSNIFSYIHSTYKPLKLVVNQQFKQPLSSFIDPAIPNRLRCSLRSPSLSPPSSLPQQSLRLASRTAATLVPSNVAEVCMYPTRQLRPKPLDFSTSSFPTSRATLALNATPSPSLELEKELHGQYMVYLYMFMFIDLSILEPAAHPSLCAVNTTTTVCFSYYLRLFY